MRPLLLVALLALLTACAADPVIAPRDCTPGTTSACACPGASGAQTCTAAGTVGACVCPDAGGADVVAVVDAPVADAVSAPDVVTALDVVDADGTDVVSAPDAVVACDAACPEVPGAVTTCEAGVCGWACRPGRIDCDRNAENGCEIDGATDPLNCGDCGTVCPAAPGMVATCSAGVCGTGPLACSTGTGNCDGDVANGCEADLRNDPRNCGACGTRCAQPANTRAVCSSGTCATACNPNFADCDGDSANGCETNLQASTLHCGRCGNRCSYPNAVPACMAPGTCRLGGCERGWCDRDRNPANGCEIRC